MDATTYRPPTAHAKVNDVAIRCFRDIGDGDYIAARLAMRARLGSQFLWSAEQAVEKYLKCILMLNRISTKDLDHDIERALQLINTVLPFKICLSAREQAIFEHLVQWNSDRYLITSFHLMYEELLNLDMLVWRLRQYCQPLDVEHYADVPSEKILLQNIKRIEAGLTGGAKNGHIGGGRLEQTLEDKNHPAREALIWKNFRYHPRQRKIIAFPTGLQAVNAPLYIYPEVAQEASKWMKIKGPFIEACNALVRQRKKEARDAAKANGASLDRTTA